jgi:hypothetical protein
MALRPPHWRRNSSLARGIGLSHAHTVLGSGVQTHVDLLIGSLPLRLCSRDSLLLSAASKRYQGFTTPQEKQFPIRVEREPAPSQTRHAFVCDFEGARVEADGDAVHFSGVRHEYALDSLLRMYLSWALLPQNGFLLHAASVLRNGKAYIFVGRSGAGKSTVASLSPRGSVLTDEISLIERVDGAWRAFGTPFWGEFRADGMNTSAPVAGIFRLLQSRENRVEPLRPTELLKSLLPCILFFSSNRSDNELLLQILVAASREVAGYNLQFQKNRSFWEVLPS